VTWLCVKVKPLFWGGAYNIVGVCVWRFKRKFMLYVFEEVCCVEFRSDGIFFNSSNHPEFENSFGQSSFWKRTTLKTVFGANNTILSLPLNERK